ncbi:MAG TPA: TIGR03619 family F420-dependent LLM class oxidoreductase [Myxococcota bacterium]
MGPTIKLGVALRSLGPQSSRETFLACARAAEDAGLDHVWVQDHVAIPPDDAEGSGGRYLDPLGALAFLAGATSRIGLGTGVLNLPYRAPLPTAKAIATLQELSAGRLLLGVGVGWMAPEFRALGVPRAERGARTDAALAFLADCFANDVVEAHGQKFLFLPRPPRPPIYVGGAAPHALARAAKWGDGWMPMARDAAALRAPIAELRERFAAAGRGAPAVVVLTGFSRKDPAAAAAGARALAEAGATHLVFSERYADEADFCRGLEFAATLRPALR